MAISALLCLARHSLLANILHPAKRFCTVSGCSLHSLHWLFSVSPLTSFQTLISTIFSIIGIMADVFLVLNSDVAIYYTFCLVYCIFHFAFPFSVLFESYFLTIFPKAFFFTYFRISLNSLSNIFPSNLVSSPSNCTVLPFVCIVNVVSSLVELHSFLVSKPP